MIIRGCEVFFKRSFHSDLQVGLNGAYIDRIGERIERYKNEKILDCERGGILLPGFNDAHTHLATHGLYLTRPRLERVHSPKEALEMVRETIRKHEKGELVIFEGFDESAWDPKRKLTKEELDEVAPLNPVILRRICGHMAIANSLALALLPIDAKGVDRDNGSMYEWVPLNINEYFPPDFETWKMAILVAQEKMINLGITSVTEFGGGVQFKAYQEILNSRQLKIRVNFNFYEKNRKYVERLGICSGFGNVRLRLGGVKTFLDGSVGARTAAFFLRYRDGGKGRLLISLEKLENLFLWAEKHGIQLLLHAIGDRAIDRILRATSSLLKGVNPLRHRIEHAEFISQDEIEQVSRLGLYLSMQPNFVRRWGLKSGLYENALGSERGLNSNPYGSILRKGIPFAFGSDAMPPGPIWGIWGAIMHPIERERLTEEEAIDAYTRGGALFSGEENIKGEIKKGMLADLAIFEDNPFEVLSPEEEIFPSYVIIDGEIVKGPRERETKTGMK